jgi:hypothetical protein
MAVDVRRWSITVAVTITLTLSSLPVNGQTPPSSEQIIATKQVAFFCKVIQDPVSGTKIPTTVAWVPERQGNIRIIGWKSEFFNKFGWDAQKRCDQVTPKLQKFYDSGQLQYLATGQANGYPIVCGLKQENEECNGDRQLFTLKPHDDPTQVLLQLLDILQGKTSDLLLQSSDGETLVPVSELFRRAPVTDRVPPCRRKPAGSQATPEEADQQVLQQLDSARSQWQVCPPK